MINKINKQSVYKGMRWRVEITLLGLFLLITLAACGADGVEPESHDQIGGGLETADGFAPDDVIAVLDNGTEVKLRDFQTYIGVLAFLDPSIAQYTQNMQYVDFLLNQMIAFRLLSADASEDTLAEASTVSDQQIEQFKMFFEMQMGADNSFAEALVTQGITEQDLRDYFFRSYAAVFHLEQDIQEEEVRAKYDELLAQPGNRQYISASVRHILIMTRDPRTGELYRSESEALTRAEEVIELIQSGRQMADLVEEYSDDGGSIASGGLYVDQPLSAWVPEFAAAAASLPLNTLSEPIQTDFGYHVMMVEERESKAFEEVRQEVQSRLLESRLFEFIETELSNRVERM